MCGSVVRIHGRGCGDRRLASTVFDRWTKVLPPTRARTTTKRAKAIITLAVLGRPLGTPKRAFVAGDRKGKGCPIADATGSRRGAGQTGTAVKMIEDHYGHITPVKTQIASVSACPAGRVPLLK